MQATTAQSLSTRTTTLGLSARRSCSQPRVVTASAVKGNRQERAEDAGTNKLVMSAVGALAAAQLVLGGPVFAQTSFPQPIRSQNTHAEKVVADLSSQQLEAKATDAASKAGNKVLDAAKGKGGASGLGEKAQGLANKAKNAAPDLSMNVVADLSVTSGDVGDVLSGKVKGAGEKASSAGNMNSSASSGEAKGKASDAQDKAKLVTEGSKSN